MAIEEVDWGALLLDYRRSRGLKQLAAAQDFAVSQATISRWEAGLSVPPPRVRRLLYAAARRDRSPMAVQTWVELFRKTLLPGLAVAPDRTIAAMSAPLANALGIPPEAVEHMPLTEVCQGECLELDAKLEEAGFYRGRIACYEAVHRISMSRRICAGPPPEHFAHYVAWPNFGEDGIGAVRQGRIVSAEEASDVRGRLGGSVKLTLL